MQGKSGPGLLEALPRLATKVMTLGVPEPQQTIFGRPASTRPFLTPATACDYALSIERSAGSNVRSGGSSPGSGQRGEKCRNARLVHAGRHRPSGSPGDVAMTPFGMPEELRLGADATPADAETELRSGSATEVCGDRGRSALRHFGLHRQLT